MGGCHRTDLKSVIRVNAFVVAAFSRLFIKAVFGQRRMLAAAILALRCAFTSRTLRGSPPGRAKRPPLLSGPRFGACLLRPSFLGRRSGRRNRAPLRFSLARLDICRVRTLSLAWAARPVGAVFHGRSFFPACCSHVRSGRMPDGLGATAYGACRRALKPPLFYRKVWTLDLAGRGHRSCCRGLMLRSLL